MIGTGVSFFFCVRKGKNKKYRIAAGSVLLAFAAGTIGSALLLSGEISQYEKSKEAYNELHQYVEAVSEPKSSPEESADASDSRLPSVNFEELLQKGPDVKAWLALPDTSINYPVVQGKDNDYYLKHLYDGTANKTGSIFLDYENKPGLQTATTLFTVTICATDPCSLLCGNTQIRDIMTHIRSCI